IRERNVTGVQTCALPILVTTPDVTHYEYARQALAAGKNVVVEKPFAATLQQAEKLVRLSEDKGKLLIVFQNRRWDSDFQAVQQEIGRAACRERAYDGGRT